MIRRYEIEGEHNGAKLHEALIATGVPCMSVICDYTHMGALKGTNVKVIVEQGETEDFTAAIDAVVATQ